MTQKTEKKAERALVKEDKARPEMQVFREFEHAMLDMERRLDRVVRETFGDEEFPFPLLQGLALQRDGEGRLRFQPFGHLQENFDKFLQGWREPLLTWDIGEGGKTVVFRAEVPGARKSDLNVEVTPDSLRVEADSGSNKYRAQCNPGFALDPASAEARYADGVLTVSCRLAEPDAPKSRKLAVR